MKLISIINHESGLKIKLEGIYKWIVFLPSTGNKEVPVPTRYYGVFDDGELKCRGMEIRRHDTPDFISLLQGRIIKKLAAARSYEQFLEQMKSAKLDVDEAVSRLLSGHVSPAELVFTKRFSKTEYRGNSAQSIVAKKLKQTGYSINPGEYARYIISNKDSGFAENRYALAGHRYDRKAYAKLARDAYRNLFLPFLKPQPTLFEVLRCVNARTETQGLPIQVKARALREAR